MREYPILFSGEMVRAILDGRKTVTRRVIKPQPTFAEQPRWSFGDGHSGKGWYCCEDEYPDEGSIFWGCPYGQPGDLLVPLTTWAALRSYDYLRPLALPEKTNIWTYWSSDTKPAWAGKLRPGRFLPTRFRHLLPRLENSGVSVEQVQDISDADVIAEGVEQQHIDKHREFFHPDDVHGLAFAELWNSINVRRGYGWDVDPWVWVVRFKQTETKGKES